jgi:hypothetical protein
VTGKFIAIAVGNQARSHSTRFMSTHEHFKNPSCVKLMVAWPKSASELYRPSDRRLSAKLVPTFYGQNLPRGQRNGSPTVGISISRLQSLIFLRSSFSVVLTRLSGPSSRASTSQKIW